MEFGCVQGWVKESEWTDAAEAAQHWWTPKHIGEMK